MVREMVFTADSEASKLADAVNKLVATKMPDAARRVLHSWKRVLVVDDCTTLPPTHFPLTLTADPPKQQPTVPGP